jgi:hypothetical protein
VRSSALFVFFFFRPFTCFFIAFPLFTADTASSPPSPLGLGTLCTSSSEEDVVAVVVGFWGCRRGCGGSSSEEVVVRLVVAALL